MDSVALHLLRPKEVESILAFLGKEAVNWAPEGLNRSYLLAATQHNFIHIRYSSIHQRFDNVFYEYNMNGSVIVEDWYSSGNAYQESLDALVQVHSGRLLFLGLNDKTTGVVRGWEIVDSPREMRLTIPNDFATEPLPTLAKKDAYLVMDLLSEDWQTPQQARDFVETVFQIEHSHSKVILEDKKAIAFAHALIDQDKAWIDAVYVRQVARGRGYGQHLIRALIGDCRDRGVQEVFLGVDQSNTRAITLYKKLGFEFTLFRKFQFRVR